MKKKQKKTLLNHKYPSHLDFLSKGLGCHALCLLDFLGILDILKKEGFCKSKMKKYRNPHLLRGAFVTLVGCNVITFNGKIYDLTNLGKKLSENIGILTLPIMGYRMLFAKQYRLINSPKSWHDSDIDYSSIADSSTKVGNSNLDPSIMKAIKSLKPKGRICDFGCGTGEKLVKICKETACSGLGIEKSPSVVRKAKKILKQFPQIKIEKEDIMKLEGVWEDVEIGLLSQVYHDLNPNQRGIKFLKSLEKHFPNLRFLVIADIVSAPKNQTPILPGFDYVHGLQGITPRDHEETLKTFSKANFAIIKELNIRSMPNTFVWILKRL